MSDLASVFNALSALPVAVGTTQPAVFNYNALPSEVQTALLPCRLLVPLGVRADARSVSALAFGGGATAVLWRLTDLLLWEAAGQGRGLLDHAPVLVEYMDAYVRALERAKMKLGGGATVENVTFEPLIAEYPLGGGDEFYAVEVTLSVKDIT